jgi:hypothetical protein
MILDGARVYFEGVKVDHEYDDKIRQIVCTIKSLSPSSEVSMRFMKSGNLYEVLLWGKASEVPIGVYNRGQSMAHVLDTLYKKVKKQSLKVLKMKGVAKTGERTYLHSHEPMAMAG